MKAEIYAIKYSFARWAFPKYYFKIPKKCGMFLHQMEPM